MDSLKSYPIWVVWKLEKTADGRPTKVPYQINGQRASSTDPSNWSTYEEAEAVVKNFSGLGFVISPKYPLLCFDFDHVLKDGELFREDVECVIDAAKTYVETSPSNDGLHLILEVEEPFPLVTNKKLNDDGTAFEAYTQSRYFTYTGNPFGAPTTVRKVSVDNAQELLRMIGYPWGKKEPEATFEPSKQVTPIMDNDQVLMRMFRAKNGKSIRQLYDGDISLYMGDDSAADFALLMHLAFWTRKNASQMEEIWLQSPLGHREKTQKRKDYRDRSIETAISQTTKVYENSETPTNLIKEDAPVPPVLVADIKLDGENSRRNIPHRNVANVVKILRADNMFANSIRYNKFNMLTEVLNPDTSEWEPLNPSEIIPALTYLQNTYNFFENLSSGILEQAMVAYGIENKVNPPVDLIKSIEWDQVPRIDSWLTDTFGAEFNAVNRAIASNWIKGLIKRVCKPGCQFDTVLVLEGAQGIGKSSALRELGRPWHAETVMDITSKDFYMILSQNIIVEFSEGATLSRAESKHMKQMITDTEDNFRRPYDRQPVKVPRRCVFAMTTNEDTYLQDKTGNRRWLPVKLPDIEANIDHIRENRLQMFAEAYHRVFNLNETVHEFPEELAEIQEDRVEEDPWVNGIITWYFDTLTDDQRDEGVTTLNAFQDGLWDLTKKDFSPGQASRVGQMFQRELFLEKKRKKKQGEQVWKYYATAKTNELGRLRLKSLSKLEREKRAQEQSKRFYATDRL